MLWLFLPATGRDHTAGMDIDTFATGTPWQEAVALLIDMHVHTQVVMEM